MTDRNTNGSTPLDKILRPFQDFIQHSASGGIVLVSATVVALILANSALAGRYHEVLHTEISFTVGSLVLSHSLLHWINDGLMTIFFLLVGLEIKREVLIGELSSFRAALLPVVAAVGGAIVPAILYALFNHTGQGASGWGIPMATDIAFTLGLLALLGDRVPFALKIFVTAAAIVDDLIAILVIAFFYSEGINGLALGIAFAVLALMIVGNLLGIRRLTFYLGLGVIVWLAFLQSGVHATVAGVLIALTIPARKQIDPDGFLTRVRRLLDRFDDSKAETSLLVRTEVQQSIVAELEEACEQVQTPLQRLEHTLQQWVAFAIMPIFALANAGITLSLGSLQGETSAIALGIVVGLVVGKPIGILGASWLTVRSGVARLPQKVRWAHLVGAACLAGIGFTMSLFIAALGLGDSPLLEVAKLGILTASLIAGTLGYMLLRRIPVLA